MPGRVVHLVETRYGRDVQDAGHGDDKGSRERGSAAAVVNEAKNKPERENERKQERLKNPQYPQHGPSVDSALAQPVVRSSI